MSKQFYVGWGLQISIRRRCQEREIEKGRSARHVITTEKNMNMSKMECINLFIQSISISYILLLSCLSRPYDFLFSVFLSLPLLFSLIMHFICTYFWKYYSAAMKNKPHPLHFLLLYSLIANTFAHPFGNCTFLLSNISKKKSFCIHWNEIQWKNTRIERDKIVNDRNRTKTNNQFMIK